MTRILQFTAPTAQFTEEPFAIRPVWKSAGRFAITFVGAVALGPNDHGVSKITYALSAIGRGLTLHVPKASLLTSALWLAVIVSGDRTGEVLHMYFVV